MFNCWEPNPRALLRRLDLAPRWGPVAPQTLPMARSVASILVPERTFPGTGLGMFLPPRLPRLPRHHPRLHSWLSPMSGLVPPRARPTPPAMAVLWMSRVLPPFAWKLEIPGRKTVRVEFLAATSEMDAERQTGE